MTCPDLCTAAKCEELENRIGALEQALELLEAAFEAHTQQQIPEAHDYTPPEPEDPPDPEVTIGVYEIGNNQFGIAVTVGENQAQDSFSITIPEPEQPPDPEVTVGVYEIGNNQFGIAVTVGENQAQDSFSITIPEPEQPPDPEVTVGVYEIGNNQFGIAVTVGENQAQDNFSITVPQAEEPPQQTISLSASFRGDVLTITAATPDDQASTQVSIPREEINNNTFITEEIVNCDFSDDFNNLRNIIVAEIEESENNTKNELDNIQNLLGNLLAELLNKVQTVEDVVTIDITDDINSKYECQFQENEDESIKPGYPESIKEKTNINGQGLIGIQQYLKVISSNLDSIHTEVCKTVDPITEITGEDLYKFCNDSDIKRSDFSEGTVGDEEYTEAINAYLASKLASSKYGYLVSEGNSTLIEAPNNWITPILADFALIQSRIATDAICNLEFPEVGDVVAITASDKVLDRHQGKTLVLHLVTFENYPKRSPNSTYWQQQIPEARSSYNWDDDFKNLVWQRGNLYAELYLTGIKDPVSGWFADKVAANSWFTSILELTTATERNRKYHEQLTPVRTIAGNTVRPYRAFITSVNSSGRGVCEVKYVPLVENE